MENTAFFLTFITTIVFCVAAALHIHIKVKKDMLSPGAGILLYCACALIAAVVVGIFLPGALVNSLDGIGIIQDFGHGGKAIAAILNFGLGIIMVPVGIILIKWNCHG